MAASTSSSNGKTGYLYVKVESAENMTKISNGVELVAEVTVGKYSETTKKAVVSNGKAKWGEVFAFENDLTLGQQINITVKHGNKMKGESSFPLPLNILNEPQPTWNKMLLGEAANTGGQLMTSMWFGNNGDKAYKTALSSRNVPSERKKFCCLQVEVSNAKGIICQETDCRSPEFSVQLEVTPETVRTKTILDAAFDKQSLSYNPRWNETFKLIVEEPLFGKQLEVAVQDAFGQQDFDTLADLKIPLSEDIVDNTRRPFDLKMDSRLADSSAQGTRSNPKIFLKLSILQDSG